MKILALVLLVFPMGVRSQVHNDSLKIGNAYGGGIIFYLDPSRAHGLIAAERDLPELYGWGFLENFGAKFMFDGDENTAVINEYVNKVKAEYKPGYYDYRSVEKFPVAAAGCASWVWGGYHDWYLPAINELRQVMDNQQLVGGFRSGSYCSSTEFDKYKCWGIVNKPGGGAAVKTPKGKIIYMVRCVRKF